MIRAAKLLRAALRFGDYSGGMMPADVVEGAQLVVFAARHDDRLSANVRREKLSLFLHLIHAPDDLPARREHVVLLQPRDRLIEIPRRRNRPGVVQRIVRIVKIKNVVNVSLHGMLLSPQSSHRI